MDVTLRELQAYLAHHYKKYGDDHGLFMKLVEEIGEVAEALNRRDGRKSDPSGDAVDALAQELADVIHYAAAIAAVNNIDLTRTMLDKDEQAAVKYHHDVNLRDFIAGGEAE